MLFHLKALTLYKDKGMPEITIKYRKPETLKVLKGLAKYFDFKITSSPIASPLEKESPSIDDILMPGNKKLDIS